MLAKEITYTDYDGNTRTETFHFNLNKVEITKMEHSVEGGLDKMIERLADKPNGREIIEILDQIILTSYGEKSLDGKRFIKSPELTKAFQESEAYVALFEELGTSGEATANFINAIIPKTGVVVVANSSSAN